MVGWMKKFYEDYQRLKRIYVPSAQGPPLMSLMQSHMFATFLITKSATITSKQMFTRQFNIGPLLSQLYTLATVFGDCEYNYSL